MNRGNRNRNNETYFTSINDIDFKQLNTNDMSMPDPELMDAFIHDLKNHESGSLVPETLGADYFFIRYFITEDMRWDFDKIEEDFMKHCYDKLRVFAKVQWYEQNSIRFSSPEESHRYMVMGLILNGAKAEDEYCKALIADKYGRSVAQVALRYLIENGMAEPSG